MFISWKKSSDEKIVLNEDRSQKVLMSGDEILRSKAKGDTASTSNQCAYCGKQFKDQSNFNRHLKYVHGGKFINCPHCDHKFRDRNGVRRHVLFRHSNVNS